jgi:hypothetical protein
MIREQSNIYDGQRQCELCSRPYVGRSDLIGICQTCCKHLGGGKHSAKGMQQEAKIMKLEGRRA